jgi:hypothetical protein
MKKFAIVLGAALLSAGLAPAAALADDAAASTTVEIKRGDMLYTADGKRVGNVYRVTTNGDVQLIYRSKMITVAASTLSQAEGKLTTSLTLDEVRKAA